MKKLKMIGSFLSKSEQKKILGGVNGAACSAQATFCQEASCSCPPTSVGYNLCNGFFLSADCYCAGVRLIVSCP